MSAWTICHLSTCHAVKRLWEREDASHTILPSSLKKWSKCYCFTPNWCWKQMNNWTINTIVVRWSSIMTAAVFCMNINCRAARPSHCSDAVKPQLPVVKHLLTGVVRDRKWGDFLYNAFLALYLTKSGSSEAIRYPLHLIFSPVIF